MGNIHYFCADNCGKYTHCSSISATEGSIMCPDWNYVGQACSLLSSEGQDIQSSFPIQIEASAAMSQDQARLEPGMQAV